MLGHILLLTHLIILIEQKTRQIVQTEKKFDQESSALLKYPVAMVLSGICHYYELAKLHLRNDIVREPYGNRDKKQNTIVDQNAHICFLQ